MAFQSMTGWSWGASTPTTTQTSWREFASRYTSSPTPTPTPVPVSVVTGLTPQDLQAATYGKVIPLWVGGAPRIGCYIVWGPKFDVDSSGAATASFGVSFGFPADPAGTRELRELRFDGKLVWTATGGSLISGLTHRFYPGSETQLPDPLVTAENGNQAVAFRGQVVVFFEKLKLTQWNNKVPFVSAVIADSTYGDPDEGLLLGEALEALAYSPYVNLNSSNFETSGITERCVALIVAQETSFVDLVANFARLYPWDIIQGEKLRVLERTSVVPDLEVTLEHILADAQGGAIRVSRIQEFDVPRELEFKFIDVARDYEQSTVPARRARDPVELTAAIGKETIELPIVTTASEARSWVTFRQYKDALARDKVQLTLLPRGMAVEPSDHLLVEAGFKNYVLRLLETVHGANGIVQCVGEPILICRIPTVQRTCIVLDFENDSYVVDGHNLTAAQITDKPENIGAGGITVAAEVAGGTPLLLNPVLQRLLELDFTIIAEFTQSSINFGPISIEQSNWDPTLGSRRIIASPGNFAATFSEADNVSYFRQILGVDFPNVASGVRQKWAFTRTRNKIALSANGLAAVVSDAIIVTDPVHAFDVATVAGRYSTFTPGDRLTSGAGTVHKITICDPQEDSDLPLLSS